MNNHKNLHILIFVIIFFCSTSKAQFRSMLYVNWQTGAFEEESKIGERAEICFWKGDFDSSLYYMDSLQKIKPEDEVIPVNKMLVHGILGEEELFRPEIVKWINKLDTNAVCSCLEQSEYFKVYRKKKWFKQLINDCWIQKKKAEYSDVIITDKLMYLKYLDQNYIKCKPDYGGDCLQNTDSLLRANLNLLISYIDTLNLPSHEEVGIAGRQAIFLVVLHSDFDPYFQIRFGERMISQKESYPASWGAWIVDRAFQNLGKNQKYGSFPSDLNLEDITIINSNRGKIGLPPLNKK